MSSQEALRGTSTMSATSEPDTGTGEKHRGAGESRKTLRRRAELLLYYIAGKWKLRRCTRVGIRPIVYGRIVVLNGGEIEIGDRFVIRATHLPVELMVLPGGKLTIGNHCFINTGVSISVQKSVVLGDDVRIGMHTVIMDTDFHETDDPSRPSDGSPVVIESGAWIATRVTILKGVTIGRGAVVAAGAVVTRDVPPRTLVAGVPARVIRSLEGASDGA